MRRTALASILALLTLPGAAPAESALAERLGATAAALRSALPEDVRGDALYPFDDPERTDIHFAPFGIDGAEHGELHDEAALLTEELLALSLAPRGLETARLIRRNELAVAEQERAGWVPEFVIRWMRDPGRYFVALIPSLHWTVILVLTPLPHIAR
jgi:hypothetical protein